MDNLKEMIAEQECANNRYNLKCLAIMMSFLVAVWVLNALDIFIIEEKLMNYCAVAVFGMTAVVTLVCFFAGLSRPFIKYLLVLTIVIVISILGIALTYHAVMLFFFPIMFACQYSDRKVLYFAYGLSIVGVFVAVMGGYYVGICDANMLLLTTSSMHNYLDETGKFVLRDVNPNPWVYLPLYYVLPRCLILLSTMPVISKISAGVVERARHEQELRMKSERDEMTGVYNKNKYLQMVKEYYPEVARVGVIYLDANGLKRINDRYGHETGDEFIFLLATAIKNTIRTDRGEKIFRVGGDEFVVVFENESEGYIKTVQARLRSNIYAVGRDLHYPISASIGYAVGSGKELEQVVSDADQVMYLEKLKTKGHR